MVIYRSFIADATERALNAYNSKRTADDELKQLINDRDKKIKDNPSYESDSEQKSIFEGRKSEIESQSNKALKEIKRSFEDVKSVYREFRKIKLPLKTVETIITVTLITFFSASILSILFLPYLWDVDYLTLSSYMFLVGIILLIGRVYLHSIDNV